MHFTAGCASIGEDGEIYISCQVLGSNPEPWYCEPVALTLSPNDPTHHTSLHDTCEIHIHVMCIYQNT